jgi:hypothetical protein
MVLLERARRSPHPNQTGRKKQGGNIAGSKQLDPSHNNKISAIHLSSWNYDAVIPSIEIEVGRVIKVPAPYFGLAEAREKGLNFKMPVIEHTNAHNFGTKAKADYSAGFRLKDVSEYSKGKLKTAYAVKKTVPFEDQWMAAPTHQRLRHNFWLAKPKDQGGAYRSQTERSLQHNTP